MPIAVFPSLLAFFVGNISHLYVETSDFDALNVSHSRETRPTSVNFIEQVLLAIFFQKSSSINVSSVDVKKSRPGAGRSEFLKKRLAKGVGILHFPYYRSKRNSISHTFATLLGSDIIFTVVPEQINLSFLEWGTCECVTFD